MRAVFILLALLCASRLSAAEAHVILITIDGFPGRMLEDPKAHLPNIRALAADGASAKGMKVSTPSVTWPNHTTLITGVQPRKHSVLFNGVLSRGAMLRVDPDKTAAELVSGPTIFDLLHESGLKTAGVNWPCTRGSKSIDDDFPDSPNTLNFTTPRFKTDLAAAGILRTGLQEDFAKTVQPERDEIWTKAACYLIAKRMPDFMAVHLLNTDSTHHKYGPESMASYTALALADRFVGEIVNAVQQAGLREQTTLIVTADHGFATATNVLQPNVLFRQAGLLEVSKTSAILKARVQAIPEGGTAFIYLNDPATREEDRKKVIELLTGKEGVADLIAPERFAAFGLPEAGQGGMADFVLRPQIGYAISGAAAVENFVAPVTGAMSQGYHGYVADEPLMNALFVASGRGIKKGARLAALDNVDIAPLIMRLLGKPLPHGDGKVPVELLKAD